MAGSVFVLSVANASELKDSQFQAKGSQVRVDLGSGYYNASLTVSGPGDFSTTITSSSGSLALDLIRAGATEGGLYTYNLTAATNEFVTVKSVMNNGRDGGVDPNQRAKGVSFSGSFVASNGIINDVMKQGEEE